MGSEMQLFKISIAGIYVGCGGTLGKIYWLSSERSISTTEQIQCNHSSGETYDQQEIDFGSKKKAISFRAFGSSTSFPKSLKAPAAWSKAYPQASSKWIHSGNYLGLDCEGK